MKKLTIVFAALLVLAILAVGIGMSVSASPKDSSPITNIPCMMLEEDYLRFMARIDENCTDEQEHEVARLKAFYTPYFLEVQISEKAREAMIAVYPVTQVANVYVVDPLVTAAEAEAIEAWFFEFGGFVQQDLIDIYTNLHDAVKASDVENKDEILASLPEIPTSGER